MIIKSKADFVYKILQLVIKTVFQLHKKDNRNYIFIMYQT